MFMEKKPGNLCFPDFPSMVTSLVFAPVPVKKHQYRTYFRSSATNGVNELHYIYILSNRYIINVYMKIYDMYIIYTIYIYYIYYIYTIYILYILYYIYMYYIYYIYIIYYILYIIYYILYYIYIF